MGNRTPLTAYETIQSQSGRREPEVEEGIRLVEFLLYQAVKSQKQSPIREIQNEYRGLVLTAAEADAWSPHLAAETPSGTAGQETVFEIPRLLSSLREKALQRNGRFGRLIQLGGFSAFELGTILLSLAPETDARFARMIAYAQDDITKKLPSIDLALRLLVHPAGWDSLRDVFSSQAPLRRFEVIQTGREAGPWPLRSIQLSPRVAGFLLGSDQIEEKLQPYAHCLDRIEILGREVPKEFIPAGLDLRVETVRSLSPRVLALAGGSPLIHRLVSRQFSESLGIGLLEVDFPQLVKETGLEPGISYCQREAKLQNAVLLLSGLDLLEQGPKSALIEELHRDSAVDLVILSAPGGIDWPGLSVNLPDVDRGLIRQAWTLALAPEPGEISKEDIDQIAGKFWLTPEEIYTAVQIAQGKASSREGGNGRLRLEDAYRAARSQSSPILNNLALKIEPKAGWEDLVLPDNSLKQLKEMLPFVEHRALVYDQWGFGQKLTYGQGLMAMFVGPPGTGKTMAAGVLAAELGLDLYRIDLSGVISKYIGETEKNLNRIFTEAEHSNAILFFDEADALFGKRSEVRDSHDRYANIEIAYLLQRMEEYSGVVILATNLNTNIDSAFLRRMHFVVEFPMPGEDDRRKIWKTSLPAGLPLAGDVDLGFLSRQFKISGGSIRNILLAAAFLAAADGQVLGMRHLVQATRREFQKTGKLVSPADFAPYDGFLEGM